MQLAPRSSVCIPTRRNGMKPLALDINQFGKTDEIQSHIRHSLSLGLPEYYPALCAHDGHFVVAGSGPSLPDFVEELRAEQAAGRPILTWFLPRPFAA